MTESVEVGSMSSRTVQKFVEKYFEIVHESADEYAVFCIFHNNIDTPALYINKKTGLFFCHNPACGEKGRFKTLVKKLGSDDYDIKDESTIEDAIAAWGIEAQQQEVEISLDNVMMDYDTDEVSKLDYMIERGFTIETLRYFEIGYSQKKNRITIPVRDVNYKVVGIIGRALNPDAFAKYEYSKGFPRRLHLFNLQNAKHFNTAIVTEGSLDAIKVHQAGYHNVVATLGAQLSSDQATLLNKYFDELIIFADNDEAGKGLKNAIMEGCPRKGAKVVIYPEGFKDPGEMNENQIGECIDNAIDSFDYLFANVKAS